MPNQRDRWKRGVDLVNGALGEAVGQIYVQRHYPPESSRQMGELIDNFRAALQEKIETNSWMDAPTKKEALAKLATFDPRTGHPAKYIDYSSLKVDRVRPVRQCHARRSNSTGTCCSTRMKKPVDRTLWGMTPQTNNAYYDPTQNQITFPAGDPAAALFRSRMPTRPPITAASARPSAMRSATASTTRAASSTAPASCATGGPRPAPSNTTRTPPKLVKQYDAYEPIPGVHIKGQLTLGENLGDLGGLEVAYAAYRRYVAKHGEPPVIGGLTGDQRFFIAYGYSWQRKTPRGRASRAAADRRAFAGRISRQRRRPEHGRLVQGVQRPARRQDVPAARAAGAGLVGER